MSSLRNSCLGGRLRILGLCGVLSFTTVAAYGDDCVGMVLDPNNAHFTRPGYAYLGGPNGMTVYDPNVMRRRIELSCSAGQAEVLPPELPGGHHAIPWCVTQDGLWALGPSISNPPIWAASVWLSADGSSWVRKHDLWFDCNENARIQTQASLFALSGGRFVAFGRQGDRTGPWYAVWSDDPNEPWHNAIIYGGTLSAAPGYIHNVYEAPPRNDHRGYVPAAGGIGRGAYQPDEADSAVDGSGRDLVRRLGRRDRSFRSFPFRDLPSRHGAVARRHR